MTATQAKLSWKKCINNFSSLEYAPILRQYIFRWFLGQVVPLYLSKSDTLNIRGDDDVRYQAKIRHVREQIVAKAFNNSQSLLDEIEFPSFFHCRGWSLCGQEYWPCWEVGLRQYVGCWTLDEDRGVEIVVYLGILSMILVNLV